MAGGGPIMAAVDGPGGPIWRGTIDGVTGHVLCTNHDHSQNCY